MSRHIHIYEPNSHIKQGFFRPWGIMFGNLLRYRELILQLFIRDFLGGFKKSIFGIGWLFLSPIIGIIAWVFYASTGILQPGNVGVPYPAYVLVGSIIYGTFTGFYSAAAGTIEAGGGFIMQVNYPHEILLFKQVAQYLAEFFISFVLNIAMLILFGITPSWHVALLPILILPLFFFGAGLGLLVSVANVVSNDIGRVVGIAISLIQIATPVIYSSEISNETVQILVKWNPLAHLIANIRNMIFFGEMSSPDGYLISTLISFVTFLLCWRLFYVSEQRVIEKRLI